MIIHTVLRGETLYSVASRYGVEESVLAFNNDITAPESLPVGMPLGVVMPTLTHLVKSGETLQGIADSYKVPLIQLYRNNLFLYGSPQIFPGQRLYITVKKDLLGKFTTGGYAYDFINAELLDQCLPLMGSLMPFTYGFTPSATLIAPNDGFMLSAAAKYQTQGVMHLSTLTGQDNFSVELAEQLFASAEMQSRLLDNIIAEMQKKGYTALDVDFEFLGGKNAQKYADFIAYSVSRLKPLGIGVMTALAPKTSDTQPGALYEGHNYALLGSVADGVLLMTYEWGYTYGPPMAVSPIQPVERVVDYALSRIPANKIFLGISNYGYDFVLPYTQGVSRANSVSAKEAFRLASLYNSEIFFDNTALAPYFNYSADNQAHRVWFEDIRSISARLRLMAQKNLKGALWWNLNRPNNQNLIAINNLIDTQGLNLLQ